MENSGQSLILYNNEIIQNTKGFGMAVVAVPFERFGSTS